MSWSWNQTGDRTYTILRWRYSSVCSDWKKSTDKPCWRSLNLNSVPMVVGGASILGSLLTDPSKVVCKEGLGPTGTQKSWRMMGPFSIYNTVNPRDVPVYLHVWLSSASSPWPLECLVRKQVLKYTSVLVSAQTFLLVDSVFIITSAFDVSS